MGKINFNAFSSKILHFSDQIKHFFAEIFWRASQAARKLRIICRSGYGCGDGGLGGGSGGGDSGGVDNGDGCVVVMVVVVK